MSFRVYATCDIGREALDRLRERGFELEVYDHIEPPPQKVILDKVRSGIDALITTLRDRIDEEVFAAGAAAAARPGPPSRWCETRSGRPGTPTSPGWGTK